MDITQFIALIASQGPLGIMLVIVSLAYRDKDKQLKEETSARIQDAKDFTKTALDLQSKSTDMVNKLADIFEEMKRQAPPVPGMGRR